MREQKDKKICVFDIEGDSLNPTKIWVMSAAIFSGKKWRIKSTTNYDEMRSFFLSCDVLIGHNITLWDVPHIERLLDIKIKAKLIDTLALSWYLEPYRMRHGLEYWGEEFGIKKPKIDNWEDLSIEEYTHRCEEDVKINCKLIDKQYKDLMNLYDNNEEHLNRLVSYLMFKMDCAREAEASGWKLDIDRCEKAIKSMSDEKEEKIKALTEAMPKVKKWRKAKKPSNMRKKDGSLSTAGWKWLDILEANNLPEDHKDDVEYVDGYSEPNPNSTEQVKDWLYSMGWEPCTFKYDRNKETGQEKKIPQVRDDGELTDSVLLVAENNPAETRFFIRDKGQLYLTIPFLVLIIVDITDVVFAVDSVPAVFGVTRDPYLVFFSNIFAVMGLRSLYFLLGAGMDKFYSLKYGLSMILVYIGLKMLLEK